MCLTQDASTPSVSVLLFLHLQHSTRNTLDCDQSNVYSSRAVVWAISQGFFVLPLYIVGRLVTLPHEISFESLSL